MSLAADITIEACPSESSQREDRLDSFEPATPFEVRHLSGRSPSFAEPPPLDYSSGTIRCYHRPHPLFETPDSATGAL
jgi:hypothetical protein